MDVILRCTTFPEPDVEQIHDYDTICVTDMEIIQYKCRKINQIKYNVSYSINKLKDINTSKYASNWKIIKDSKVLYLAGVNPRNGSHLVWSDIKHPIYTLSEYFPRSKICIKICSVESNTLQVRGVICRNNHIIMNDHYLLQLDTLQLYTIQTTQPVFNLCVKQSNTYVCGIDGNTTDCSVIDLNNIKLYKNRTFKYTKINTIPYSKCKDYIDDVFIAKTYCDKYVAIYDKAGAYITSFMRKIENVSLNGKCNVYYVLSTYIKSIRKVKHLIIVECWTYVTYIDLRKHNPLSDAFLAAETTNKIKDELSDICCFI